MHQVCVHLRRRNGASLFSFCDINERNSGYKITVQLLASRSVYKWRVHSDLKEKFLSFVCLFIFLPSAFIVSSSYFFCYPHFPIHIRHPQLSGSRLTDTPSLWKPSIAKKVIPSIPRFSELFIFSPANSLKPLISDTSEVLLSDWLASFPAINISIFNLCRPQSYKLHELVS